MALRAPMQPLHYPLQWHLGNRGVVFQQDELFLVVPRPVVYK